MAYFERNCRNVVEPAGAAAATTAKHLLATAIVIPVAVAAAPSAPRTIWPFLGKLVFPLKKHSSCEAIFSKKKTLFGRRVFLDQEGIP